MLSEFEYLHHKLKMEHEHTRSKIQMIKYKIQNMTIYSNENKILDMSKTRNGFLNSDSKIMRKSTYTTDSVNFKTITHFKRIPNYNKIYEYINFLKNNCRKIEILLEDENLTKQNFNKIRSNLQKDIVDLTAKTF